MKIQIDGTGMQNKGAELMLYAILGEIEKRFPTSTVIYNTRSGEIKEIETFLNIKQRLLLKYGRYPSGILRRLKSNISIFESIHPDSSIDIVLDGSGFKWGDQWNYDDNFYKQITKYYKALKASGAKIILLPQAFGPFQTENGRKIISILNKYVDLIIAREKISYKYLIEAGIDKEKASLCTDFSLTVKGEYPSNLNTSDGLCIIPNVQMINHSDVSREGYINFLRSIITKSRALGSTPFLLNHEGSRDLDLCLEINKDLDNPVKIINGLNAKQTKGVISESYAVISSRYHGVASALNQGIPCLATSWSHKYGELFKDFDLYDRIISFSDSESVLDSKLEELLTLESNHKIEKHLKDRKVVVYNEVEKMWDKVFSEVIQN